MSRPQRYQQLNTSDKSLDDITMEQTASIISETPKKNHKPKKTKNVLNENLFTTKTILWILMKLNCSKLLILIFVFICLLYYSIFWRESYYKLNSKIIISKSEPINIVLDKCKINFKASKDNSSYVKITEVMLIKDYISFNLSKFKFKTENFFYYNPRQLQDDSCEINFYFPKDEIVSIPISIRCDNHCEFMSDEFSSFGFSDMTIRALSLFARFFNLHQSNINFYSDKLTLNLINIGDDNQIIINSFYSLIHLFNTSDNLPLHFKINKDNVLNNYHNYAFQTQSENDKDKIICLKNNNQKNCKDSSQITIKGKNCYLRSYNEKNQNPDIKSVIENLEIQLIYVKFDDFLKLIVDNADDENFIMKIVFYIFAFPGEKTKEILFTKNFDTIFLKGFLRFQNVHSIPQFKKLNFNLLMITSADQYDLRNVPEDIKIIFYEKIINYFIEFFRFYVFNENYHLVYLNNKIDIPNISVNNQNGREYVPLIFYSFYILYFIIFIFSLYLVYKIKKYLDNCIMLKFKEIILNWKINDIFSKRFLVMNVAEIVNLKNEDVFKTNNKKFEINNEVLLYIKDYYYYVINFIFKIKIDSFCYFLNSVCFKEEDFNIYITTGKLTKVEFSKLIKKYRMFCLVKNYQILDKEDCRIIKNLNKMGFFIHESINDYNYYITNIKIKNFEKLVIFNEVNMFDNNQVFDSLNFFIKKYCKKSLLTENRISIKNFTKIYENFCDRFFLGKKKVELKILKENYEFEIKKEFKKYVIRGELQNSSKYHFNFTFLEEYVNSNKESDFSILMDKNSYILESLFFKKEEKKMTHIIYFLFTLSTVFIILNIYDWIFYFYMLFKLENIVETSDSDVLLSRIYLKTLNLNMDMNVDLLAKSFVMLIFWNIIYSLGVFLWLRFGNKKTKIFKNGLAKIFQYSFILALFLFLLFYIFDAVVSLLIFFYFTIKISFSYFSMFLAFVIRIAFLFFFYLQLQYSKNQYKKKFLKSFEDFKYDIFNEFLEKKKYLQYFENQKKEYQNRDFNFTLDNFLSEKKIVIKEIFNSSCYDNDFLLFFKNYFLMIKDDKLDEDSFFKSYLALDCFKNSYFDKNNIFLFLKKSHYIVKSFKTLSQEKIDEEMIELFKLFSDLINPHFSSKTLSRIRKDSRQTLEEDFSIRNSHKIKRSSLLTNSLNHFSNFSKNNSDLRKDSLNKKNDDKRWSQDQKSKFYLEKMSSKNSNSQKSLMKQRNSKSNSRDSNKIESKEWKKECLLNNNKKNINVLFLIILHNFEKIKGRLNIFYKKLNEFYICVYKKKYIIKISTVSFFIRNYFNFELFQIHDNIEEFNNKLMENFVHKKEKMILKAIFDIINKEYNFKNLKDPKKMAFYFKNNFSFNSFFTVFLKNTEIQSESFIAIKKKRDELDSININLFKNEQIFLNKKIMKYLLIRVFSIEKELFTFFTNVIYYLSHPREFKKFADNDLYLKFEKNFGNFRFFMRLMTWVLEYKNPKFKFPIIFEDEYYFDLKFKNPIFLHYFINLIDFQYVNYMRDVFKNYKIDFFDIYEYIMKKDNFNLEELYSKFKKFDITNKKKIQIIYNFMINENRDIRFLEIEDFYKIFPKLNKNLKSFFKIFFFIKDLKYSNLKNLKRVFFYFAKLFDINTFLEEDFQKVNFFILTRKNICDQILKIETKEDIISQLNNINDTFRMYTKTLIKFTDYLLTKKEELELEIALLMKKTFDINLPPTHLIIFLRYLHFNFLKSFSTKITKELKLTVRSNVFDDIKNQISLANEFSQDSMLEIFEQLLQIINSENPKNNEGNNKNKKPSSKINQYLLHTFDHIKYNSRKKEENFFEQDFKKLKKYLIDNNKINELFIFDLFYFFKEDSNIFLPPFHIWTINKITQHTVFTDGIIFFIIDFFLRGRAIKLYEFSIFSEFINKNIFKFKTDKHWMRFFDFSFVDNLRISMNGDSPDFQSLNNYIKDELKTNFIQFLFELRNNTDENLYYKKLKKNSDYYRDKYKLDVKEIATLYCYIKKKYSIQLDLIPPPKYCELNEETKQIAKTFNLIEKKEPFSVDIVTKKYLLFNSVLFQKLNLSVKFSWIAILFKKKEISLARLFLIDQPFVKSYKGKFIVDIITQFVYLTKVSQENFLEDKKKYPELLKNEYFDFDNNLFKFFIFENNLKLGQDYFSKFKLKKENKNENGILNSKNNNKNEGFFEFFLFLNLKYLSIFHLEYLFDFFFNEAVLNKINIFKNKKFRLEKEYEKLWIFFSKIKDQHKNILQQLIKNSLFISTSFFDQMNNSEIKFLIDYDDKVPETLNKREKLNFILNKTLLMSFGRINGKTELIKKIRVLKENKQLKKPFQDLFSQLFQDETEENEFVVFLIDKIKKVIENSDLIFKKIKENEFEAKFCKIDDKNFSDIFIAILLYKTRQYNDMSSLDLNRNSIMIIATVDLIIKIIQKHTFLYSKKRIIVLIFSFVKFFLLSFRIILPKEFMPIFSINLYDPINIIYLLYQMKKTFKTNTTEIKDIFKLNPSKKKLIKCRLLKKIHKKDEMSLNCVKMFRNFVFGEFGKSYSNKMNLNCQKIQIPFYYNIFTKARKSLEYFYFLENITKLESIEKKIFFYQNMPNYYIDGVYFKIQMIERNHLKDKYKTSIPISKFYEFYYGNDFSTFKKRKPWIRFNNQYFALYEKMTLFDISIKNLFFYDENYIDLTVLSRNTQKYLKLYRHLFELDNEHSNQRILQVFSKMKFSLKSDLKNLLYVFEFLLNKEFYNFLLFDFLEIKNPHLENIILIFHQRQSSAKLMIKKFTEKQNVSLTSLNNIKSLLIILSKDNKEKKNIKTETYNKSLFCIAKYFVPEKKIDVFEEILKILLKVNDLTANHKKDFSEYKNLFEEYLFHIKEFFTFDKNFLLDVNNTLFEINITSYLEKTEYKSNFIDIISQEDVKTRVESEVQKKFGFFMENIFREFNINYSEEKNYINIIKLLDHLNQRDIVKIFTSIKDLGLDEYYCCFLVDYIFQFLFYNSFEILENLTNENKENFFLIILYKIVYNNEKESEFKKIFLKKLQNDILQIKLKNLEFDYINEKYNQINFIKNFFKKKIEKINVYNEIKENLSKILLNYFGDFDNKNNSFLNYINEVLIYLFLPERCLENSIKEIDLKKEEREFFELLIKIEKLKNKIYYKKFPVVERLNQEEVFFEFLKKTSANLYIGDYFFSLKKETVQMLYLPIIIITNLLFSRFMNILYKNDDETNKKLYIEFILNLLSRIFEEYDHQIKLSESDINKFEKEFNKGKIIEDEEIFIKDKKSQEKEQKRSNSVEKDIGDKKPLSSIKEKKIKKTIDSKTIVNTLREFEIGLIKSDFENFESLGKFFADFHKEDISIHEINVCQDLDKNDFYENFIKITKQYTENRTKPKNIKMFVNLVIDYVEKNYFFEEKILSNPLLFLQNDPSVAEFFCRFLDINDVKKKELLETYNDCLIYRDLKKHKINENPENTINESKTEINDKMKILRDKKIYNILDIIRNFQNFDIHLKHSDIIKYLLLNVELKENLKYENNIKINEFFEEIKKHEMISIQDKINFCYGRFFLFVISYWFLSQFFIYLIFEFIEDFKTFSLWLSVFIIIFVTFFAGEILLLMFFKVLTYPDKKKQSYIGDYIKNLFQYFRIK